MNLRSVAKSWLPESVARFAVEQRWRHRERRFAAQGRSTLRCGQFDLECPADHPLQDILRRHPNRDACVGLAARCLSEKYPDASFVDIGANIGDTAAMMATHAPHNGLILVEGSDYFFPILERNAAHFPNAIRTIHAIVGGGREMTGKFHHWGGTAVFVESDRDRDRSRSVKLEEVADVKTRFVKIDTDGFDFEILHGSMAWLMRQKPAILFEDQIRTRDELLDANSLVSELHDIGYEYFVVWDDPGDHVVSTSDPSVISDLNRYLCTVWQRGHGSGGLCNYDVLCLHRDDANVYKSVLCAVADHNHQMPNRC